jgi:hypothetical protein
MQLNHHPHEEKSRNELGRKISFSWTRRDEKGSASRNQSREPMLGIPGKHHRRPPNKEEKDNKTFRWKDKYINYGSFAEIGSQDSEDKPTVKGYNQQALDPIKCAVPIHCCGSRI